MELHSMGIGIRHESTFMIDRPIGSGDNLFLIFKTRARVWCDKEWVEVAPGSFIIYKKNWIQKYGAVNMEYVDHYIHFDSRGDGIFDELKVVTNVPGYLENIEEIETLLRLLSREQISESDYKRQNADLLLQILFRKIAENQCEEKVEKNDVRHLEELKNLRSEMYASPGKYGSIRELAQEVNLSLSHFQSLYSEYFKVSCYEDLLNARISNSKEFLEQNDLSIREIAFLCGYENDTCFMRCFKKRTGMTPSEYRASISAGKHRII